MLKITPSPLLRPPGLVIFDCDGVLVDTEGPSNHILTMILQDLGLEVDEPTVASVTTGLTMTAIRDWAADLLGRPLPADFIDTVYAQTYETFRAGVEAVPGVMAAVDAVQATGTPTCVASSGALEKMAITLGGTGLLPRFEGRLFSARQVARGKPHPDVFLFAADQMGFAPADAVVIEDSVPGVNGAIAAGMKVFAYAAPGCENTGHGPGALADAGGVVFQDMALLPELLALSKKKLAKKLAKKTERV
jgi:HAD superfamily hydrolase (TIGR01509 family)